MNRTWTGLAVRKLSKQRNHVDQDLKMFPRVGSTAVLGWLRRRAHMVCIPNFCRETDSISIPRSFSQVWAPGCQFRLPAQRTRALTRPKSEWKPSSWVHQLLPATSFYHFLSHTSCYPQVPQFSPESPEAASPVPCHTCPEQQLENHWTGNTGNSEASAPARPSSNLHASRPEGSYLAPTTVWPIPWCSIAWIKMFRPVTIVPFYISWYVLRDHPSGPANRCKESKGWQKCGKESAFSTLHILAVC